MSEAHDQLISAFDDFRAALDPVKDAAEGDREITRQEIRALPNAVVEFQGELVNVLQQYQEADIEIVPGQGQQPG